MKCFLITAGTILSLMYLNNWMAKHIIPIGGVCHDGKCGSAKQVW